MLQTLAQTCDDLGVGWLAAAAAQVRDMLTLPTGAGQLAAGAGHTFDSAPRPVDQLLAAMLRTGPGARVGRDDALSVAAVQRGRNELCAVGTLPLALFRGLDAVPSALLRQIDPDVPNVVTLSSTIEDLAFEGIAWWEVLGRDFDNYPIACRHVDVARVSLAPPNGKEQPHHTPAGNPAPGTAGPTLWLDGVEVSASRLIRFDSPNPGLLRCNGGAVRRALALGRIAEMFAENPQLREYFTDGDNPDVQPLRADEIDAFIAEYQAMRKLRPVGWLPSTVKRADVSSPSPVDLQLVQLQQQVTLEIAQGIGVDPEDLGVSTTSRTYFNGVDRRQEKINRTYAPFMRAITDRLSMGDVTRRGYAVRFDLVDYLKADPATQVQYWRGLWDMDAISSAEVRQFAGIPGAPPQPRAAAPADPAGAAQSSAPRRRPAPVIAARHDGPAAGYTFDGPQPAHVFAVREFAAAAAPPTVDVESRTITGLALPYNTWARKYGLKYRFRPGSLEYGDVSRVKHLQDHGTPVGGATQLDDKPEGLTAKLSVLGGPDGSPIKLARDQLLYDAQHGLYDGLSVGVDFSLEPDDGDVEWVEAEQGYDVVRATLREISSTPMPVFDDARVTTVAASRSGGNQTMKCPHCGRDHSPGIACATFAAQLASAQQDQLTVTQSGGQPATVPGQPAPAGQPQQPVQLDSAAYHAFMNAMNAYSARQMPQQPAGPVAVNPHHGPVSVTEPAPYRFDRTGNLRAGSHDFSADLHAGWRPGGDGDRAARDRAQSWIVSVFGDAQPQPQTPLWTPPGWEHAVTPGNVATLNPTRNRPEMYVDQLEYEYPLWQAINKGTLDGITPFTVPKFNSSGGLVADHTSGTEPTPGTFTATSQTINPSPVSGKIEILRETWDQGGNPQASGLIWRQMVRAYFEALEAYAAAQLALQAANIADITITTAAVDGALDSALSSALVPLQFIRGGNRFRTAFTQIDLYKAMTAAKDTTGRRLYPSIGAANTNGTVEPRYAAIDAHGIRWLPAWALAASGTVAASSYMFDPERVAGWATAPQQIDIQWRVAWVDIGIFGYKAFALTDVAGAREVIYDPL